MGPMKWYAALAALAAFFCLPAHSADPAKGGKPDRPAAPAVRYFPCVETLDDEGVALGERLEGLHGSDFEKVYLEHARHVVEAQQRAAQVSDLARR